MSLSAVASSVIVRPNVERKMTLAKLLLLLLCVSRSSAVSVLKWPPLNCSQQGLRCEVTTSNCMDRTWLEVNSYTPSSPEELQVSVDTRYDEKDQLQPVVNVSWKIKDDGSIVFLKATEVHVLVVSTNQNLCVRYSFKDKLPMRSPLKTKWSFLANMITVEPGQRYRISVFNIPKPELSHSNYDVSTDVTIPGCQTHTMQHTQFCTERGSRWQPNISLARVTAAGGISALAVGFSPDQLCEKYIIIVRCSNIPQVEDAYKTNQTTLNVTFSLDKWPRSCCQFDVEVKPLFPHCGQDCVRSRRTLGICPVKPTDVPPDNVPSVHIFVVLGVVLLCAVLAGVVYAICKTKGKPGVDEKNKGGKELWHEHLKQAPKVLVIYSQDHHLYRDVVLKLCNFLQAKCGTKVLIDLLDSASVDEVGRLRWLELQREELKGPSDKILVLCSRGVQAKWRAMCGQEKVTLREDVLSPTDDIFIPFLSLVLPDMHQAGMLGKYLVAFFEDISSEQDVPSVFDIAVKYKLMKQFEELYFRILDIEKYQPHQNIHIDGISGDEYVDCPSGKALKTAIEKFQAYQLENPKWFENECVGNEEELIQEASTLMDQVQAPLVLEVVPLIRTGLPLYMQEMDMCTNGSNVHILSPEINTKLEPSVSELTPVIKTEHKHQCPLDFNEFSVDHMYPYTSQSVYTVEPVLRNPLPQTQNWPSLTNNHMSQLHNEEDSQPPVSQHPMLLDNRGCTLPNSFDLNTKSSLGSVQSEGFPLPESSHIDAMEMEEYEVLNPSGKGQSSGSDQGYSSKMSSPREAPFNDDPLDALRRLQEELLQTNLRYFDRDFESH